MDERTKELHYQTLCLLRKEIAGRFSDWKDADDWLFSELDFTQSELAEIFDGKSGMVYTGSAIAQ